MHQVLLRQHADKVAQLEAENAALQQQLDHQDATAQEASLQQQEHSTVFGDKLRIAASRVLAFKVFAAAGPIVLQSTALLLAVAQPSTSICAAQPSTQCTAAALNQHLCRCTTTFVVVLLTVGCSQLQSHLKDIQQQQLRHVLLCWVVTAMKKEARKQHKQVKHCSLHQANLSSTNMCDSFLAASCVP